jgi:radical SAM protein with 4Fe4S-binding SPASM domain
MNKFCSAPWINMQLDTNGEIRPCCRYSQYDKQYKYKMPNIRDYNIEKIWNHKRMQNLRQAFIDGKQPDECVICWDEEEAGIQSFREKYNKKIPIDTTDIISDMPMMYDFKLNNICNLKCRMCGPQTSSLILKEKKKFNNDVFPVEKYWRSNKILNTKNEKIFFDNLHRVKELEFTGGEPFFSKENKNLITKIGKSEYAKNISIQITTNGMIYDKSRLDILNNFKFVNITISVDDIGLRLEYARKGAKWNLIQENIYKFIKNYPNWAIYIYRTINNYNIWYLEEFDRYALINNLNTVDGFLHVSDELSIKTLNPIIKNRIKEKYSNKKNYKHVIDFLMFNNINNKQDKTVQFHKHIRELDKIRKEDFNKTFTEWSEIILYNAM